MSSQYQTSVDERKSIEYEGDDLMEIVNSLMHFGSDLDTEDENDIRERASDIGNAFEEDTGLVLGLWMANVNRVKRLHEAFSAAEASSEHSMSTASGTAPSSTTSSTDGIKLAVGLKINDDAIYDISAKEPYDSELKTATRGTKRLTQEVLKLLVAEHRGLRDLVEESSYLEDALTAAVQVILFSPLHQLETARPGVAKLLAPLQYLVGDRDWYMTDQKVKAILANSKGEMHALVDAVKVFWHPKAHAAA
jgi:hypothetical protein